MIPAEVIAQMASLGLDGAQAAAVAAMLSAVEAATIKEAMQPFEAEKARVAEEEAVRLANKRQADRERQHRHRMSRVTDRDNALSRVTPPLPDKERSPTPPKEINPTPIGPSLRSGLVDEPVDVSVAFEKAKKNNEALKAFGEGWNQLAAALSLPSIDEIKPGSLRERQALARLREMPPDGVQTLMTRIRGSPYLRGEVNGFRVSFDWIIKPSNYQKIMEGNYEVRKVAAFGRHGPAARLF
jgi:hypothetical protein